MAERRVNWSNVRMLSGELGEVDLQQLDELTDADDEEGWISLAVKSAFPLNRVPEAAVEQAERANFALASFLTELTKLGSVMVDELAKVNRDSRGRVLTDAVRAEIEAERLAAEEAEAQRAMDERIARESSHRPESSR